MAPSSGRPIPPQSGYLIADDVLAAYADSISPQDPLSGLVIGERPAPATPEQGWTTVTVKAAALNHHDLWSLRGVGLSSDRLPMILGCDAAGLDRDGNEVIVHAVIGSPDANGDETFDPGRSILSERHQGTLAGLLNVPERNLIPKPAGLSFEEAACLPTAWLTAYRMLFTRGRVIPGQTILVQGSSGGVATALIVLASQAGIRVWATGRSEEKRELATQLGAAATFEPGARLPERVDAVMDTVGGDTWSHTVRALKPGGTVVVSGATAGAAPPAELNWIFFRQITVVGSTMGSRDELERLTRFMSERQIKPRISAVVPLTDARAGFEKLLAGDTRGKIVIAALDAAAGRDQPSG